MFPAAAGSDCILPLLSVPLKELTHLIISNKEAMQTVPLLFVLLEMLLRSSRASNSSKLQALHMMTILTRQCDTVIIFPSFAAMLPLLGALVTSSKVFVNTNWDFESLAAASELLLLLIKQACELAVRISDHSQHLYEQNQQQQQQNGQEAGQEYQQQQDEGKDKQKQQQHKQRGKGQEQQQGSAERFKDEQQQQDQAGQAKGKGEGRRCPRDNQQQLPSSNAEGLANEAPAPSSTEPAAAARRLQLQGLCWAACHGLLAVACSWTDMAGAVHSIWQEVWQKSQGVYEGAAADIRTAAGQACGVEQEPGAQATASAGYDSSNVLGTFGLQTTTAEGRRALLSDASRGLREGGPGLSPGPSLQLVSKMLLDGVLLDVSCKNVRNCVQQSGVLVTQRMVIRRFSSSNQAAVIAEARSSGGTDKKDCLRAWVGALSAAAYDGGEMLGANGRIQSAATTCEEKAPNLMSSFAEACGALQTACSAGAALAVGRRAALGAVTEAGQAGAGAASAAGVAAAAARISQAGEGAAVMAAAAKASQAGEGAAGEAAAPAAKASQAGEGAAGEAAAAAAKAAQAGEGAAAVAAAAAAKAAQAGEGQAVADCDGSVGGLSMAALDLTRLSKALGLTDDLGAYWNVRDHDKQQEQQQAAEEESGFGKGLQALQSAFAFVSSNPVSFCCNNVSCCNMGDQVSELGVSLGGRGGVGGVCQGCKEACYCSRDCQLQHWAAGHKDVCSLFAAAPENAKKR